MRRHLVSPLGMFFILAALIVGGGAWSAFRPRHAPAAPSEADLAWDGLVAVEAVLRHDVDFAKQPTWDPVSGPDPYALRTVPGPALIARILPGAHAALLLHESLHELDPRP